MIKIQRSYLHNGNHYDGKAAPLYRGRPRYYSLLRSNAYFCGMGWVGISGGCYLTCHRILGTVADWMMRFYFVTISCIRLLLLINCPGPPWADRWFGLSTGWRLQFLKYIFVKRILWFCQYARNNIQHKYIKASPLKPICWIYHSYSMIISHILYRSRLNF